MQSITNHQPEHTPGKKRKENRSKQSEIKKRETTVTNKQIELDSVKQRKETTKEDGKQEQQEKE